MKKTSSPNIKSVHHDEKKWYVLYVKSRAEKKVYERLVKNRIEVFLPLIKTVRQWSDRKKQVVVPLFNGYLFVYTSSDLFTLIKMVEGVVDFVKTAGQYAVVREEQVLSVKQFIETGFHIEAQPDQFEAGEKVKINFGPLKDVAGELIEIKNEKHFIVRIEVINQVLKASVPAQYLTKI